MMEVNDLFTARFVDGGRGPAEYDCFGLFEELSRRRGVPLPAEANPVGEAEKAAAIAAAIERGEWSKLDRPEPGCGVAFIVTPPFVSHIGMVMDDGQTFMHISRKTGVAIERLDSPLWAHRIAGFYCHG